MIWWPFFYILADFHHLDSLADHQKLNVIQKQVLHILMIWWPFFFAFWLTFVAHIACPIIKKLNVIQKWAFHFLTIWWPFFCISVNFPHSDSLADHQKLNVIQKWAFHFLMIWQPFCCIMVNFHHSYCLADHQKLNAIQKWAFHFWWLGVGGCGVVSSNSNITVIWKPEIQIFKYPFEIEIHKFPVQA